MIIDAVSDLHGYFPDLKGGDLLILCGDYTASDKLLEWSNFFNWLKKQDYKKKILVAGNHDNFLESGFPKNSDESLAFKELESFLIEHKQIEFPDFEYLCDSGTEFNGIKIWGTPWTPWFHGVNPKCTAFMKSERRIEKKFSLIPEDTDILITHGPPFGILDKTIRCQHVGSLSLRDHLQNRIKPKFHFFGHIHEKNGKKVSFKRKGCSKSTRCMNVSYVDERYEPNFKVSRVII